MNSILPEPTTIEYLNNYSGVYFLGAPKGIKKDPWHICRYIYGGSFDVNLGGLPQFRARLFVDLDE